MPLRKFFAQRGVSHPAAYSMAVLALGMIVCMTIAVGISVQASNRALRAEQARERAADERARHATCVVVDQMKEAYADPTTPTGVKAGKAWDSLGVIFQCEER